MSLLPGTNRAERREYARALARENHAWPLEFVRVPEHLWPVAGRAGQLRVWRNRHYLVQEFEAPPPARIRLTVSKTSVRKDEWEAGIAWEELQRIKNDLGYADACAVEVYPPRSCEVNVANMRHLWVLTGIPDYVWKDSDHGSSNQAPEACP